MSLRLSHDSRQTRLRGRYFAWSLAALLCMLCCLPLCALAQGDKTLFVKPKDGAKQTGAPTKWALLVGVEEYERRSISRLEFGVKDVTAVAEALQQNLGFPADHVVVMTSNIKDPDDIKRPTNSNVFKVLGNMADAIGPDDTVLIYFTGHGFSKNGENFLGTVNTDPGDIDALELTSVPVTKLENKMRRIKARQVIFIIDACRNDPEKGKGDADNKLTNSFAKSLEVVAHTEGAQIGGSAVFFACSDGERAFEDFSKNHSVFTYYLLEALQGKAPVTNGRLTIDAVAEYVQQKVQSWAHENGKQQTPRISTDGPAKIVLAEIDNAVGNGGLQAGGKVRIIPTDAQLTLTTVPPGAHVSLDGQDTGKVTPTSFDFDMDAPTKDLIVKLQAPGYHTLSLQVTLAQGKLTAVDQPLKLLQSTPLPVSPLENDKGAAIQSRINPTDGAEMVFVPAGPCILGNANSQRTVSLRGYWIYKYPVTVAQFRKYLASQNRAMPKAPEWGWRDNDPMVNVSFDDAVGYARWAKADLPTNSQWEKAARGTDGRLFPWGNDYDLSKMWCTDRGQHALKVGFDLRMPSSHYCVTPAYDLRGITSIEAEVLGATQVGRYPAGAGPNGAQDMVGLVKQWCVEDSERSVKIGERAHLAQNCGIPSTPHHSVRGGGWKSDRQNLYTFAVEAGYDTNIRDDMGFRCVAKP